jgi:hypothetical protein
MSGTNKCALRDLISAEKGDTSVNRRTFVESLSALFLAANSGLLGRSGALNSEAFNSEVSDASRAARGATPRLLPVPASVSGVRTPVLSLAGTWKFTVEPPSGFWNQNLDTSTWPSMEMPNEFAAHGFSIAPNIEYPCRRKLLIPADYRNRRIFLRFDGVYGYARVWINGVYLRDHFGGFTSWDCEITDHVNPGEEADLVLGITDRSDDISQATYYAKHSIAGILRGVRLFAAPLTCLRSLDVSTEYGPKGEKGIINLAAELSPPDTRSARLLLALTDDSGASVPLTPNTISIGPEAQAEQKIVVQAPKSWDAEHPNLYTLKVSLVLDGQTVETLERKIGFRTIRREGNRLLVNGSPIKLRGVCRHSIHPIYGRAVPAEFDELDAALLRAANINFVRTSHYPPSEQFLDACDRHGIYVEEEAAVCWSNVENGPSSNPEFTARFMSQFQEMIERDRGHASVLFWSLGNESQWGANFAAERRFALENSDRPVIFSYPDTVPMEASTFDIYSRHYPDVNAGLSSSSYPLLNDEFAHISCYNLETLRLDPGIRNFWGRSIRRFGEKFLAADGCLGGSIWAGIDEIFLLPGGPEGYGPWGVIDGWRRPKPEYWLTAKAYSPIRMEDRPVPAPPQGSVLSIPITNAFDHTNLRDVDIRWAAGSNSGRLLAVDLAPHRSGYLEIPPRAWKPNDALQLDFYAKGRSTNLIDRFRLRIDPSPPALPKPEPAAAVLSHSGNDLLVTGPNFSVAFSQTTGLIREAVFDGKVILTGGPFLDLGTGPLTSHWLLHHFEAVTSGDTVSTFTSGECKQKEGIDGIPVEFEIEIDGCGLLTTRYRFHADTAESNTSGVAYMLPAGVDRLSWHRDSLWSVYPDDHIGRPWGVARKKAGHLALSYRARPEWPWSEDMEDAFLWGKDGAAPQATNDFRSLKENIWYAACTLAGSNVRARAEANADVAVRASVLPDGQVAFSLYNQWSYPGLGWGNYTGPSAAPALNGREVRLRLTDLPEEQS